VNSISTVLDMSIVISRLLELPQELLDGTIAYLEFKDLLHLRLSCACLEVTARRLLLLHHLREICVTYSGFGLRQAAALLW